MTHRSAGTRARLGVLSVAGATLLLAACAGEDPARPVAVGTTVALSTLDPAGTTHRDTLALLSLVHPRLLSLEVGEDGAVSYVPELAETAEFTGETEFTITLPAGLEFSNGDELTASDVVFSFDRQLALREESGTFELLEGIVSVEAVDERTVVFQLATADDATFPAVLAGPAGAILDEEVFSADAVTADDVVLTAAAFGGRFAIVPPENQPTTRDLLLEANPEYRGADPVDAELAIQLALDREPDEIAAGLEGGTLEAAFGDFPLDDLDALAALEGIRMTEQPSRTLRFLVFDFATMPFGVESDEADEADASAVRSAVADLIDREALVEEAPDLWNPSTGYLPQALATGPGVFESGRYGAEDGAAPDPDRAAARLADAGVETPVELEITASSRSSDPAGTALREELVRQLETGGLFTVTVTEVEEGLGRDLLAEERFPLYEYRWTPLGTGVDSYLTPLFSSTDGLPNGSADDETDQLIAAERTALDPARRAAAVQELEEHLADRLPAIPLLASTDVIFSSTAITLGDTERSGLAWLTDLIRR